MAGVLTPRRERRRWNQAPQVSVRDALLSSGRDLSIVSEVSSVCEEETDEVMEESPTICRTPGVAWELSVDDFKITKPDAAIVSCPPKRASNLIGRRSNKRKEEANIGRKNRSKKETSVPESEGRLTGIRSRVRVAPEPTPKAKKPTQTKQDVKKFLSASRARQKVLKSRQDEFTRTIRMLDAKRTPFRRSPSPSDSVHVSEEEACIHEVQQTAYDRWEKAVEFAKQALEEVVEAEKVLSYAAEFDQMKALMDTHGPDWDVGIDKYIDLYKNLQTEYPETTPIKRSKIVRQQSFSRPPERKPSPAARRPHHERSRSAEDRSQIEIKASSIPTGCPKNVASQRFDPNYILSLGRRFAHSAETWFLKLVHTLVGIEVSHSVYCREDCYRLMESLSKLQNWLLNAKGTTRLDRHEVLLGRLRDTVIRWSSQMFDLPLAKSNG